MRPEVECIDCGELKPHVAKGRCNACYQKVYAIEHREELRAYRVANAEKRRKANRKWHVANAERVCERRRAWRAANIEKTREYQRDWKVANPEKHRAYEQRRRARMRNLPTEDFLDTEIFDRDGYVCQMCGRKTVKQPGQANSVNLDHIVPLSKGGHHTRANVQCACARCNFSKGDRLWAP